MERKPFLIANLVALFDEAKKIAPDDLEDRHIRAGVCCAVESLSEHWQFEVQPTNGTLKTCIALAHAWQACPADMHAWCNLDDAPKASSDAVCSRAHAERTTHTALAKECPGLTIEKGRNEAVTVLVDEIATFDAITDEQVVHSVALFCLGYRTAWSISQGHKLK